MDGVVVSIIFLAVEKIEKLPDRKASLGMHKIQIYLIMMTYPTLAV